MPQDRLRSPRGGRGRRLTSLSDFEFRVWDQYQLSSDDFGVMRCSAITVQADNDSLADRPAEAVQAALQRLIDVGLVLDFVHQERRYLCQGDWQDFQHVEYPRRTVLPKPPDEVVERCDPATRKLFAKHPGGVTKRRQKRSRTVPESAPEHIPNASGALPEQTPRVLPPPGSANANANANAHTNPNAAAPASRNGPGVFGGALPRDHVRHAWCGRKCVPDFIHGEFMRGIGGDPDAAAVRLKAWYSTIEAGLNGQPSGDEPTKFWRAQFAAAFPSTVPKVAFGKPEPRSNVPSSDATKRRMEADR